MQTHSLIEYRFMRKVISTFILGAVVLGGVVVGIRSAQPAQAMTWGQLKCMYNPRCTPPPPPKPVLDDKNAG